MKKALKWVLVSLIVFGFNSTVFATNECTYMMGNNNNTIIPKGYMAYCGSYFYDSSSSKDTTNTPNQISLAYSPAEISLINDDTNSIFLTLHPSTGKIQSGNGNFSWNGLNLGINGILNNAVFEQAIFDSNIQACPKKIYWSDNGTKTIGFCSDKCTISGNKYAVYNLDSDTSEILYFKNFPVKFNDLKDSSKVSKEINQCDINAMERIHFNESSVGNSGVDSETITPLATCTYYFELKNYGGKECNTVEAKLTYNQKIKSGVSTFNVTSSFSAIDLRYIQNKLDTIDSKNTNTFTNASDYLIYDNGTWSCVNKLYLVQNVNDNMPILGSRDYTSSLYNNANNSVLESHSTKDGLCSTTVSPNPNPSINFGDPVEVNCDGIIGKELLGFFNKIFRWIQILAPIYVIIIGGVEFTGAVLQDDKDAMKKATNKLVKRLLIAIALFFIPLILNWLLGVFNDITGAASSTCGIGG